MATAPGRSINGLLSLEAADVLHFQCEIDNTSDQMLSFANETFTGEMCSLFGGYTGANPCTRVQRVN